MVTQVEYFAGFGIDTEYDPRRLAILQRVSFSIMYCLIQITQARIFLQTRIRPGQSRGQEKHGLQQEHHDADCTMGYGRMVQGRASTEHLGCKPPLNLPRCPHSYPANATGCHQDALYPPRSEDPCMVSRMPHISQPAHPSHRSTMKHTRMGQTRTANTKLRSERTRSVDRHPPTAACPPAKAR